MQINNDSIQGMADGESSGDAVSMGQNGVYLNGTRYAHVTPCVKTGTTTSGNLVMYLTDDGTITGNALFTTVTSVQIRVNDSSFMSATSYTLSGATLTATATKQTATTAVVALVTVLIGLTTASVPNGTSLTITVNGVGNAI